MAITVEIPPQLRPKTVPFRLAETRERRVRESTKRFWSQYQQISTGEIIPVGDESPFDYNGGTAQGLDR